MQTAAIPSPKVKSVACPYCSATFRRWALKSQRDDPPVSGERAVREHLAAEHPELWAS